MSDWIKLDERERSDNCLFSYRKKKNKCFLWLTHSTCKIKGYKIKDIRDWVYYREKYRKDEVDSVTVSIYTNGKDYYINDNDDSSLACYDAKRMLHELVGYTTFIKIHTEEVTNYGEWTGLYDVIVDIILPDSVAAFCFYPDDFKEVSNEQT